MNWPLSYESWSPRVLCHIIPTTQSLSNVHASLANQRSKTTCVVIDLVLSISGIISTYWCPHHEAEWAGRTDRKAGRSKTVRKEWNVPVAVPGSTSLCNSIYSRAVISHVQMPWIVGLNLNSSVAQDWRHVWIHAAAWMRKETAQPPAACALL